MESAAEFKTSQEFFHARVGHNWVLARRTPRIVEQYGDDVVCLSRKQYEALEREFNSVRRWSWFDARWGQLNGDNARWLA